MKYQIKQLGVGGILDQSINLLRNHFGLLFGIVATTIIPVQAILGLVQYSLIVGGDPQSGVLVAALGNIAFGLIMAPLVNAAMIHAIASVYLSRSTTLVECFGHATGRYLALLGTTILMGLAIMGGFILLIMAQHVTVLEGTAGRAALGRSKALMKGNIDAVFRLLLVVGLVNFGMGIGAGMIPQPHARIVAIAVAQGIGTLLATCALVVFYFSCRCKLENFDLQVLADAVGAGAEVQPVD